MKSFRVQELVATTGILILLAMDPFAGYAQSSVTEYDRLFEEGVNLLSKGWTKQAVAKFKEAIKQTEDSDLKKKAKHMRDRVKHIYPDYLSFKKKGDMASSRESYKSALRFYKDGKNKLLEKERKWIPEVEDRYLAEISDNIRKTDSLRIDFIERKLSLAKAEMDADNPQEALTYYKQAKSQATKVREIDASINRAEKRINYKRYLQEGDMAQAAKKYEAAENTFEKTKKYFAVSPEEKQEIRQRIHKVRQQIYERAIDQGAHLRDLQRYQSAIDSFKYARDYFLKAKPGMSPDSVNSLIYQSYIDWHLYVLLNGEEQYGQQRYEEALETFYQARKLLQESNTVLKYVGGISLRVYPQKDAPLADTVESWIAKTNKQLLLTTLSQAEGQARQRRFQEALSLCDEALRYAQDENSRLQIAEAQDKIKTTWRDDLVMQARQAKLAGTLESIQEARRLLHKSQEVSVRQHPDLQEIEQEVLTALYETFISKGESAYHAESLDQAQRIYQAAQDELPDRQEFSRRIAHIDHVKQAQRLEREGKLEEAQMEAREAEQTWRTQKINQMLQKLDSQIEEYKRRLAEAKSVLNSSYRHPTEAQFALEEASRIYPQKASRDGTDDMLHAIEKIKQAEESLNRDVAWAKQLLEQADSRYRTLYAERLLKTIEDYLYALNEGQRLEDRDPQRALDRYREARGYIPTSEVDAKYYALDQELDQYVTLFVIPRPLISADYYTYNATVNLYEIRAYQDTALVTSKNFSDTTVFKKLEVDRKYWVEIEGLSPKIYGSISTDDRKERKPRSSITILRRREGIRTISVY